jgi:hypothetical protein
LVQQEPSDRQEQLDNQESQESQDRPEMLVVLVLAEPLEYQEHKVQLDLED